MKQSSGMDIFSTMEQEMKQIMDLFAKERKARKKEILKLKTKVQERDQKIQVEREQAKAEKVDLLAKMKLDAKKHQEFYDFMTKKVQGYEDQEKELKRVCYYLQNEKKDLI